MKSIRVKKSEETEIKSSEIKDSILLRNLKVWGLYSLMFMILLIPFTDFSFKTLCGGLIFGFFAGLINDIIEKIEKL